MFKVVYVIKGIFELKKVEKIPAGLGENDSFSKLCSYQRVFDQSTNAAQEVSEEVTCPHIKDVIYTTTIIIKVYCRKGTRQ